MVVEFRPETGHVGIPGLQSVFASLNEDHQTKVVRWALVNRPRVSEQARVAFNNALIGNVTVKGFRDAGVPDAPAIMLIQPIRNAALVVETVAQAVLIAWKESRGELREIVEAAMSMAVESTVGASASDFTHSGNLAGVLASANPQYSSDDVSLMIALLNSERAAHGEEEPEEEQSEAHTDAQRMINEFIGELRDLPAQSPEWDGPLSQFMDTIAELKASKTREIEETDGLGGRIAEVLSEYADLLAFFEWNAEEKLPNTDGPWVDAEAVSVAIENVAELLARYEAVREIGATFSEETSRAAERSELNERIMYALTSLEQAAVAPAPEPAIEEVVPADEEPADDEQTDDELMGDEPADDEPAEDVAEPVTADSSMDDIERQYLRDVAEALQRANVELKAAAEATRLENVKLKAAAEAADRDYQDLKDEHHELRYEAAATRLSIMEAQKAEEDLAGPPDFGDVASVIDFAENRWAGELRLALNNSSDRKLYFDQPNQVYSALEWLATTYRNSRTGEKPVGNLDVSLFTTCGWRYRPFQSDITVGGFRSDYQTIDGDKKYVLEEHIGRGTGRTPGQIRVAFSWDDERKMVIVGYIGRHQRMNTN